MIGIILKIASTILYIYERSSRLRLKIRRKNRLFSICFIDYYNVILLKRKEEQFLSYEFFGEGFQMFIIFRTFKFFK